MTVTALTDFYRGLAKVTDEFIRMDGGLLEDLKVLRRLPAVRGGRDPDSPVLNGILKGMGGPTRVRA